MAKVPTSLLKSNLEVEDSLRKEKLWEVIRHITTTTVNMKKELLDTEYTLEQSKYFFDKDEIIHVLEKPQNTDFYELNLPIDAIENILTTVEYTDRENKELQKEYNEEELRKIEQRFITLNNKAKVVKLYANDNPRHFVKTVPYTITLHYDDRESNKILNLKDQKTNEYQKLVAITINIHRYLVEYEKPEDATGGKNRIEFYSHKEIQDGYHIFVRDFVYAFTKQKEDLHRRYNSTYIRWVESINDYIKLRHTHYFDKKTNTNNLFNISGPDYEMFFNTVFKPEFERLSLNKTTRIAAEDYKIFVFFALEIFVLVEINSLMLKKKQSENFAVINFDLSFSENGNINGVRFFSDVNYKTYTKEDIERVKNNFNIDSGILYEKFSNIQTSSLKEKVIEYRKQNPTIGARRLSVMFNVSENTIKTWIKGI